MVAVTETPMTDPLLRQAVSSIPDRASLVSVSVERPCAETDIYLDYAATTPVDPAVARVMTDFLTVEGVFGNPASATHGFGRGGGPGGRKCSPRNRLVPFLNSRGDRLDLRRHRGHKSCAEGSGHLPAAAAVDTSSPHRWNTRRFSIPPNG